jgi:alkylhydroperoxidase/carboxymuconolactone decarboxylase family protein YurZ
MSDANPLEVFQREAPEIQQAYAGLIESLVESPGLDGKTKQLVYVGIKSALGDSLAVGYHVPMAKRLGATRDEVKEAVLLTLTTSGLQGVTSCLTVALDAYDSSE